MKREEKQLPEIELDYKAINTKLGLQDKESFNLSQQETEELFITITSHFENAIYAAKEKDLKHFIIEMAKASNVLIRTLYPKTSHQFEFVERYMNIVATIKDHIFTENRLKKLFNDRHLNFEHLSFIYQIATQIRTKKLELMDLDTDAETTHEFVFYYLISGFTHSMRSLVDQYLDSYTQAIAKISKLDPEKHQEQIDKIDHLLASKISQEPLCQRDINELNTLINTHILTKPMDQELVKQLKLQLQAIHDRLAKKKGIFNRKNGTLLQKVSLMKTLIDSLDADKTTFLNFLGKLKETMCSDEINYQRNLILRIPLLSYLLSCIPQVKAYLEKGTTTFQKLGEVKSFLFKEIPIATLGQEINHMTMGF